MSDLLTSDLSYNRSGIMLEAVRVARCEAAAWQRQFGDRMPWAQAMAYGLRRAWSAARQMRDAKMLAAEAAARKASEAHFSRQDREIASLRRALAHADYIDSTTTMLATKARIAARLAQLGA